MIAIQAVYDGQVFIPDRPCNIISGSKVTLTVETASGAITEKQKKLAEFRKLTEEIIELNKTDPLPPEFDKAVGQK